MKTPQRKGKQGELELAAKLRDLGFDAVKLSAMYQAGDVAPDVGGIPGVHIECKRVEKLNIERAMHQSIRDAGNNLPVVCHRRNRGKWMITALLDDIHRFKKMIPAGDSANQ